MSRNIDRPFSAPSAAATSPHETVRQPQQPVAKYVVRTGPRPDGSGSWDPYPCEIEGGTPEYTSALTYPATTGACICIYTRAGASGQRDHFLVQGKRQLLLTSDTQSSRDANRRDNKEEAEIEIARAAEKHGAVPGRAGGTGDHDEKSSNLNIVVENGSCSNDDKRSLSLETNFDSSGATGIAQELGAHCQGVIFVHTSKTSSALSRCAAAVVGALNVVQRPPSGVVGHAQCPFILDDHLESDGCLQDAINTAEIPNAINKETQNLRTVIGQQTQHTGLDEGKTGESIVSPMPSEQLQQPQQQFQRAYPSCRTESQRREEVEHVSSEAVRFSDTNMNDPAASAIQQQQPQHGQQRDNPGADEKDTIFIGSASLEGAAVTVCPSNSPQHRSGVLEACCKVEITARLDAQARAERAEGKVVELETQMKARHRESESDLAVAGARVKLMEVAFDDAQARAYKAEALLKEKEVALGEHLNIVA